MLIMCSCLWRKGGLPGIVASVSRDLGDAFTSSGRPCISPGQDREQEEIE